jgi:hypothetical protein
MKKDPRGSVCPSLARFEVPHDRQTTDYQSGGILALVLRTHAVHADQEWSLTVRPNRSSSQVQLGGYLGMDSQEHEARG